MHEDTTISSPTPVASDLDAGGMLGRYVALEKIGQGGMGRVYRAYDPKLRRELALKVLAKTPGTEGRARIMREASGSSTGGFGGSGPGVVSFDQLFQTSAATMQ